MRPIGYSEAMVYALTAVTTGFWATYLMALPLIGGPWSWWHPVALAASIVLLIGGLRILFPSVRNGWLVGLAGLLALLPWNLRAWYYAALVFAVAVTAITWMILLIARLARRNRLVPLVASCVLAGWWATGVVATVHAYLSPKPPAVGLTDVLGILIVCVLIVASVVLSAVSLSGRPA